MSERLWANSWSFWFDCESSESSAPSLIVVAWDWGNLLSVAGSLSSHRRLLRHPRRCDLQTMVWAISRCNHRSPWHILFRTSRRDTPPQALCVFCSLICFVLTHLSLVCLFQIHRHGLCHRADVACCSPLPSVLFVWKAMPWSVWLLSVRPAICCWLLFYLWRSRRASQKHCQSRISICEKACVQWVTHRSHTSYICGHRMCGHGYIHCCRICGIRSPRSIFARPNASGTVPLSRIAP